MVDVPPNYQMDESNELHAYLAGNLTHSSAAAEPGVNLLVDFFGGSNLDHPARFRCPLQ
jgi:hypothetical protein